MLASLSFFSISWPVFQENLQAAADGAEPEFLGTDVLQRHEEEVGGVVHGGVVERVLDLAAEEHVERMDREAGVHVEVGQGEEVVRAYDVEPRLFPHLAGHSLFPRFVQVDEASGQVERTFGGFFGPAAHQQLVPAVDDEGYRGRGGIEIVDKPAVGTLFGLFVVYPEAGRAALGAILELGKGMICH